MSVTCGVILMTPEAGLAEINYYFVASAFPRATAAMRRNALPAEARACDFDKTHFAEHLAGWTACPHFLRV